MDDADARLARSWEANAAAWTDAVREGRIESRRKVTDRAVVDAVLALRPARVLDAGCGEGWLARALAAQGIDVVGMDASAALVDAARAAGGGEFRVLGYDALIADPSLAGDGYDAAVCNFSLLDEHPAALLAALAGRLNPGGWIVIQTVHPWTAAGDEPYVDGWRVETFASMGGAFAEPMPWYFRRTESWVRVITAAGCVLAELREPVHPDTGRPASLLLVCYKTVEQERPRA